ncbi:hypothetical protein [Parafilimonas terrae]|uniref:hypothetical protein n=1 Tax=Parafilimonas terrae TaxID=1465490 RepID=UPI000B837584|nr:hypothetical protein [Parafilimonas terrae]
MKGKNREVGFYGNAEALPALSRKSYLAPINMPLVFIFCLNGVNELAMLERLYLKQGSIKN